MSALYEGPPYRVASGALDADNGTGGLGFAGGFHNGLPYGGVEFNREVPMDSISAIDHHHQGLPFTANGRVAVDVDGVIAYYGSGSAPFTAAGRLCVESGAITHHTSGVGYTAFNRVAIVVD